MPQLPTSPTRTPLHHPLTLPRVLRSYAPDWLLVLSLYFLLSYLYTLPGFKREFSLTDITIQRPKRDPETVGPWLLGFVSAGVPVLVILVVGGVVGRSRWDVHNGILGALMGYVVTGITTQVIKLGVGRPRPDMLSRCRPSPDAHDAPFFGLSNYTICTTWQKAREEGVVDRVFEDGFKSFPSGHSSLSFVGMGFIAFYLGGKLHLGDKRGHRTRAWLALAPLLLSTMVAVSRTADNRHHVQDVLTGSLLGFAISYVAYRAYYPPLSHPSCHLPLAPRDLLPSEADDADIENQVARIQNDFHDEDGEEEERVPLSHAHGGVGGEDDRVVRREG